jgi:hypothetical protein
MKRHQQAQACQPDQQTTLVAGEQHIVERHCVVAPRQNGEFLAKNTQRKPDSGQLDHRQQHPTQSVFIGSAWAADKGTGADVGRG